jgi:hypothetical protein
MLTQVLLVFLYGYHLMGPRFSNGLLAWILCVGTEGFFLLS